MGNTSNYAAGILATFLSVAGWGYFLYQGTIDPRGGIYSLWPLFGVSNQMLAGMALLLATVILFKMGKARFAWVTVAPALFVLTATLYGGVQKVLPFKEGDRVHNAVSHVATAQIQAKKIADLEATLPTLTDEAQIAKANKDIGIAKQVRFSNIINAILCVFFMFATSLVIIATIRICSGRLKIPLKESKFVALDSLKRA